MPTIWPLLIANGRVDPVVAGFHLSPVFPGLVWIIVTKGCNLFDVIIIVMSMRPILSSKIGPFGA